LILKGVDVKTIIKKANELLAQEKSLSPALKSMIEMLILIVSRPQQTRIGNAKIKRSVKKTRRTTRAYRLNAQTSQRT